MGAEQDNSAPSFRTAAILCTATCVEECRNLTVTAAEARAKDRELPVDPSDMNPPKQVRFQRIRQPAERASSPP